MRLRSKIGSAFSLVLVAAGLLALLGPRPRIDGEPPLVEIPTEPEALVQYLASAEARFDDIVPGTARTIVWDSPSTPERTPLSVVYLHGFSATHRETAPVAEDLARALGANLYLSRLTGHGRTGEALGDATANDWLRDTAEALAIGLAIGERVILLGVSTGGTLATWAAAEPEWRDRIAALVLISPNYGVRDSRAWMLALPWGSVIASRMYGPEYSFEPVNEQHGLYWTESYPTAALSEMAGITRLIDPGLLAEVEVPTLVFLAPDDQIIDPARVQAAFGQLGSGVKELALATEVGGDPARHVLAGDILSPDFTDWVLARTLFFLNDTLGF